MKGLMLHSVSLLCKSFKDMKTLNFKRFFFFSDKFSVLLFLIVSDSCLSEERKGKCHWV